MLIVVNIVVTNDGLLILLGRKWKAPFMFGEWIVNLMDVGNVEFKVNSYSFFFIQYFVLRSCGVC